MIINNKEGGESYSQKTIWQTAIKSLEIVEQIYTSIR